MGGPPWLKGWPVLAVVSGEDSLIARWAGRVRQIWRRGRRYVDGGRDPEPGPVAVSASVAELSPAADVLIQPKGSSMRFRIPYAEIQRPSSGP